MNIYCSFISETECVGYLENVLQTNRELSDSSISKCIWADIIAKIAYKTENEKKWIEARTIWNSLISKGSSLAIIHYAVSFF